MSEIYSKAASDNGEVVYQGKTFALLAQAELTNRIFPGWWGDATFGEEYISEWSAPAIGEDGEEYVVVWRFLAIKGQKAEDDSFWPWNEIHEVIPA